MFGLSSRDSKELFSRVSDIEKTLAVREEHNTNLEQLFIKHDKEEMIKYTNIQNRLDSMDKKQQKNENIKYGLVAIFLFFEFLVKMGYLSF